MPSAMMQLARRRPAKEPDSAMETESPRLPQVQSANKVDAHEIDLRNGVDLAALKQIPNDRTVLLYIGQPCQISAYGQKFECRILRINRKFPEVGAKVAPINFFTAEEAERLDLAASAIGRFAGAPLDFASTLAWFDPSVKAIEVPIPGVAGKKLPEWVQVDADLAKGIVASLVHEGTHSAGKGEFWAYWNGDTARFKMGLLPKPPSPTEVLHHIQTEGSYDDADIKKAEREFEDYCVQHGRDDLLKAYWDDIEKQQEREEFLFEHEPLLDDEDLP